MPYRLTYDNIVGIKADALIIPANTLPICTPGIMSDVYAASDTEKLLEARMKAGQLEEGCTFCTEGYGLKAGKIIHTIMPLQDRNDQDCCELLHKCYKTAFECAHTLRCTSIAVPVLMSDVYGFPARKAMDIAMDEVHSFLRKADMDINIILSNGLVDMSISEDLIARIDEYLGLTGTSGSKNRQKLEDVVKTAEEGFADRLFRLIDERGFTDAEVYKRANVDRRLISKLRLDPNKNASKNTALALAIGLRLSIDETRDFIALAGWALSKSFTFDRIVKFFISNGRYDIDEINEVLFRYTGKTLVG